MIWRALKIFHSGDIPLRFHCRKACGFESRRPHQKYLKRRYPPMKRIASIQDISCLGRCSLTVALPVISALGVECAIVPTAVLSAHTAFPGFVSRDLSDQLTAIAAHWRSQHVHFDALYTGYIASARQVQQVLDFFDAVRSPDTMIFVDPAMADHG